jgi:DNA modification methylase
MMPTFHEVDGGYVVHGDSTSSDVASRCAQMFPSVGLIIADPPYGNVVDEKWDRTLKTQGEFAQWMNDWTKLWTDHVLIDGGAFYVWGGIGAPSFRPFFEYLSKIERSGSFELANLITWSKKRAYGVQKNYLFTREECAYFVKGASKSPRKFNIPLLSTKRGYSGFNAKYPAKSEYYRRTNVWTDITEIMRGKLHPTQKAQRLHEVMIEVHTDPGDYVVDIFAGAGTTAMAAKALGRKFVVVESDASMVSDMVKRFTNKGER